MSDKTKIQLLTELSLKNELIIKLQRQILSLSRREIDIKKNIITNIMVFLNRMSLISFWVFRHKLGTNNHLTVAYC